MVSFTLKCFDEFRVTEKTTDLAKLKEFRQTFFFFIMFTACLKFSSKKITEPVLLVFFFLFFFCFCFLFVCFLVFFFHFWHNTIFLQNFVWPLFQNYCSFKISQNLFFFLQMWSELVKSLKLICWINIQKLLLAILQISIFKENKLLMACWLQNV